MMLASLTKAIKWKRDCLWADRASAQRRRHPQQGVEEAASVAARTALALAAVRHERPHLLPLIIAQNLTLHRRPPKASGESDLQRNGNPKRLNCYYSLESCRRVSEARCPQGTGWQLDLQDIARQQRTYFGRSQPHRLAVLEPHDRIDWPGAGL